MIENYLHNLQVVDANTELSVRAAHDMTAFESRRMIIEPQGCRDRLSFSLGEKALGRRVVAFNVRKESHRPSRAAISNVCIYDNGADDCLLRTGSHGVVQGCAVYLSISLNRAPSSRVDFSHGC